MVGACAAKIRTLAAITAAASASLCCFATSSAVPGMIKLPFSVPMFPDSPQLVDVNDYSDDQSCESASKKQKHRQTEGFVEPGPRDPIALAFSLLAEKLREHLA